jgi:hypothetical protein
VSWRIEQADALALLRELPDGWAQTCVTSLPRPGASAEVFAILVQARRVLRADSTLWLFTHRAEPLQDALGELGFYGHGTPRWAAPLAANTNTRLLLFTKSTRFFCDAYTLNYPGPRRAFHASTQSPTRGTRRRLCGRERLARLTRRCVLAGSSPLACGVCGAPYERAPASESGRGARRPTCAHRDRAGRCLVLDPFAYPGTPTGEIAHRYGRSFLGISDIAHVGER